MAQRNDDKSKNRRDAGENIKSNKDRMDKNRGPGNELSGGAPGKQHGDKLADHSDHNPQQRMTSRAAGVRSPEGLSGEEAGRGRASGPGREASTGGSQQNDRGNEDRPSRGKTSMEEERGYQRNAANDETKNDPNRPW